MTERESLQTLERRTRQGDTVAKTELQRRLRQAMFQIVQRFLRSGTAPPGYARPIERECRRLAPSAANPRDWIGEVADRLCTRLTDRLQSASAAGQSTRETVVMYSQ